MVCFAHQGVARFASADVVYGILPSAGLEGEGLEGGAP